MALKRWVLAFGLSGKLPNGVRRTCRGQFSAPFNQSISRWKVFLRGFPCCLALIWKKNKKKNVCVRLCSNSGVWVCVRASAVEPKLCQGLEDAGVSKQNKYMSWITNYRWLCGWSEERHTERGMYKLAMKQGLCSVGKNKFPNTAKHIK